VLQLFLKSWNGMIRQYSEAKTVDVPAGRDGMYVKEYSAQADWMHHGEGLRRSTCWVSRRRRCRSTRSARDAGRPLHGEDPEAPNYDPKLKMIRSMINGSKGPMLRKATALDWVGDPFDVSKFVAGHGESTYAQFLEHYSEYTDVAGDHSSISSPRRCRSTRISSRTRRNTSGGLSIHGRVAGRMKANGGIIPATSRSTAPSAAGEEMVGQRLRLGFSR